MRMKNEKILLRTPYDWVIEEVALLSTLFVFYPLFIYDQLAEGNIIPIHYNTQGVADGWTDRSLFWIVAFITLTLYIGLSIAEKFYPKFKYPIEVVESNANGVYRLAVQLIRHIKLIVVLILAYVCYNCLLIALG